jgi:AraC family transcriptional regulator
MTDGLSGTRFAEVPYTFVRRASSVDRFWTGFEASIYTGFGGYAGYDSFPYDEICMLIGPPIGTVCRVDDVLSRRIQSAGEFDILPAGSSYAAVDEGTSDFFAVKLSRTLVRTVADGMGIDPDRVTIRPQLQQRDAAIEHICRALAAELESAEPAGRFFADSLGLALAAQLLRRYVPIVTPRMSRGLSTRSLRHVTEYVEEHIALDLTLAELARIAGVSPSHFKMLFKLSVGLPVHQYVMRRRVEHAMNLITTGTVPLSDVALAAGFANQSHMARCMRRFVGATPAALRNGS